MSYTSENTVISVYKISKGGEIFLFDMGKSIKLLDLAKILIQFSGKKLKINGEGDIQIKITGLREGEKLFEELLVDYKSKPTSIEDIYTSVEKGLTQKEFLSIYNKLKKAFLDKDEKKLINALKNKHIKYMPS